MPTTATIKPFTVIGFWDDSDTPVPVSIVPGTPQVYGCSNVSEGGTWCESVNAASWEEAEALAVAKMMATMPADDNEDSDSDDEEDDDDEEGSSMLFEMEHNDVTYEIDFQGETYAIYKQEGNEQIDFFDYYGDRQDHYSIEDAAVRKLKEHGL